MNNQLKYRTRLALLAERIGQSKSFVSVTGVVQFLLDVLAWSAAAAFALVLRSYLQDEQNISTVVQSILYRVLPIVAVVQAITGYIVGIYRRRWRYGSFDEVKGLILSAFITTTVLLVIRLTDRSIDAFPRSAIVAGGVLGLIFTGASRYTWRLVREQLRRPSEQTAKKILVLMLLVVECRITLLIDGLSIHKLKLLVSPRWRRE